MIRKIITLPDGIDILRSKAIEVTEFDEDLHELLDDMAETMLAANGVGLAANQVGDLSRVMIVKFEGEITEYINPELIECSGKRDSEEGCLSLPGVFDTIERENWIEVWYSDRHGNKFAKIVFGLESFIIQHELDHLNGIVFSDHMSPGKKLAAMMKLR